MHNGTQQFEPQEFFFSEWLKMIDSPIFEGSAASCANPMCDHNLFSDGEDAPPSVRARGHMTVLLQVLRP